MEKYFANLISDNLFPFNTYRTHSAIQLTEKTANNYLKILRRDIEVLIGIVQFRQIIFGLGSSTYSSSKVLYIVNNESGIFNSITKVNELINELKMERKKVLSYIYEVGITNDESKFFKIIDWVKLLKENFFGIKLNIEPKLSFSRPSEIKEKLGVFYKGPGIVLKELSRIFFDHINAAKSNRSLLPKRNLLITGPSGAGKTYLLNKIAELLNVPFLSYDATRLVKTGYVGETVEDMLYRLYIASDKSMEKMRKGIIFIDEIDKIAVVEQSQMVIATIGVQQDLLKLLEGDATYSFNRSGEHYKRDLINFNTKNLMIICGGAFEGISEIVNKRLKIYSLGFSVQEKLKIDDSTEIISDDLVDYGMIRELVGRFHIILSLPGKTPEDLFNILREAEDSPIRDYINYFKAYDSELIFDDEALMEIANIAYKYKTGARALIRVIEKVLPLFDVSNGNLSRLQLTKDYVQQRMKENF